MDLDNNASRQIKTLKLSSKIKNAILKIENAKSQKKVDLIEGFHFKNDFEDLLQKLSTNNQSSSNFLIPTHLPIIIEETDGMYKQRKAKKKIQDQEFEENTTSPKPMVIGTFNGNVDMIITDQKKQNRLNEKLFLNNLILIKASKQFKTSKEQLFSNISEKMSVGVVLESPSRVSSFRNEKITPIVEKCSTNVLNSGKIIDNKNYLNQIQNGFSVKVEKIIEVQDNKRISFQEYQVLKKKYEEMSKLNLKERKAFLKENLNKFEKEVPSKIKIMSEREHAFYNLHNKHGKITINLKNKEYLKEFENMDVESKLPKIVEKKCMKSRVDFGKNECDEKKGFSFLMKV